MRRYTDVASYVLHRVFKLSASSSGGFTSNVLHVSKETLRAAQRTKSQREDKSRERLSIFIENLFPYQLPTGTNHYVLWLLLDEDEDDRVNFVTDEEVSSILERVSLNEKEGRPSVCFSHTSSFKGGSPGCRIHLVSKSKANCSRQRHVSRASLLEEDMRRARRICPLQHVVRIVISSILGWVAALDAAGRRVVVAAGVTGSRAGK